MADRDMRRADKEIVDREELHRILDEAMAMRLGLLDGGRPYVVPLNFAREGDDLSFHAAKAGHKLDCLRVRLGGARSRRRASAPMARSAAGACTRRQGHS